MDAKINLRELYTKETGKNSYRYVSDNPSGYTQDYINWLETLCNDLQTMVNNLKEKAK